ncbi:hypothetical protein PVBG_06087 [Plasmodium vivax Brazil I]|uniref:Variable surface protein n=1 Tax=Plasmodium vivax (strain Brazil I) TaxID=1033975 RepID=A0A0J9SZU4_PLAV1|nr:hypothetical protein PVBG_06087 [Plasmodium vivax Brazil I]
MSKDKDYILEEIKDKYNVIGKLKFYEIYKVFDKLCTDSDFNDDNVSCYNYSAESSNVIGILKNLYSNLYRIYDTTQNLNETYFGNNYSEDEKMFYISLKYWLYDQIIIKGLQEKEIEEIFTGLENHIKTKIIETFKNSCVFNKLTLDEIKRLKNIYALYTVLYENNEEFETCNNNTCMYLEYFGKGLDEFINSINSCSKLCKENNQYAKIYIYEYNMQGTKEDTRKYLLYSEENNNKPLYIYLNDEKLLNFVKTSNFLSNKKTTIAATSVVGSAIGLSSIFYYIYKVIHNDIFKYIYFSIINIKHSLKFY